MTKSSRGNYANQEELIVDASLKPVGVSAGKKTWGVMDRREKAIFAAKIFVMFASFGWIYGNTLAPDEIKPRVG